MRAGVALAAGLLLAGCGVEPLYDGRFCAAESPCPAGFECDGDKTCHRLCAINDECVVEGEVCVSGTCTPTNAMPAKDAGVDDAGATDGAADDAGDDECTVAGDCDTPGPCEESAGATCDRGECSYRRIACNAPPPAECTEGDTLFQTFSDIGACDDATEACEYTRMGVPCPDCNATCLEPCAELRCDEDHGGCRTSGLCMPGAPGDPATCIYENAEDGAACIRVSGDPGRCSAGDCVECTTGADCDDANPCTTDVCDTAAGACDHPLRNLSCNTPPGACYDAAGACSPATGACDYPPSSSARACDDVNACTHTDRCDGAGGCGGAPYSCDDANGCTSDTCDGAGGCAIAFVAPANLAPGGGQVVSTMDVTMTWSACADAVTYEVDIDSQRSDGTWADYFVYTGEPVASKTFYPCSNAAPGLPCNGDFRFRVRANHAGTFGPWSNFSEWHWGNCRLC